jgi:HEAT repeat protein
LIFKKFVWNFDVNREKNIKSATQSIDIDLKIQSIDFLIEDNSIDNDCIDFLVNGLKSSDRGVRDVCCRALLTLDDKDKDLACKMISDLIISNEITIRNLAGEILIKMGDFSTPHLIPFLINNEPDIRKYACDILGIVSGENALIPISQLLTDNDTNCINSAIEAIGNIFDKFDDTKFSNENIVHKLFDIFNTGNEDVKPNIIDTLGKIGSNESETFLLNIVRNNDDMFLKTTAIDSLAYTCNDIGICKMLMDEIDSYPKEIQSTLIKTIYAICFRTDNMIELPFNKRHIAHNALFDSDPEIRASAIVALGEIYFNSDVDGLLNEFSLGTNDIQIHILNHLFSESAGEVVGSFITKYLNELINSDSLSSEIELLSCMAEIWDNSDENNQCIFMEKMLLFSMKNLRGRDLELLEFLNKLDKSIFDHVIEEIINVNGDFKEYFSNFQNN